MNMGTMAEVSGPHSSRVRSCIFEMADLRCSSSGIGGGNLKAGRSGLRRFFTTNVESVGISNMRYKSSQEYRCGKEKLRDVICRGFVFSIAVAIVRDLELTWKSCRWAHSDSIIAVLNIRWSATGFALPMSASLPSLSRYSPSQFSLANLIVDLQFVSSLTSIS